MASSRRSRGGGGGMAAAAAAAGDGDGLVCDSVSVWLGNPEAEVMLATVALAHPVDRALLSPEEEEEEEEEEEVEAAVPPRDEDEAKAKTAAPASSACLLLLFLPSHMLPQEILSFLAPMQQQVLSFRVLRHARELRRYLGVLRFDRVEAAKTFFALHHGKPFNSMETGTGSVCHLAFVRGCELFTDTKALAPPSMLSPSRARSEGSHNKGNGSGGRAASEESRSARQPSPSAWMERPSSRMSGTTAPGTPTASGAATGIGTTTNPEDGQNHCVVCLEPLLECDEPLFVQEEQPAATTTATEVVSDTTCEGGARGAAAVYTWNCNHSFHVGCVRRLESPQCPVCRFEHELPTEKLSTCQVCGCQDPEHLWVCLLCGFIGCDRDTDGVGTPDIAGAAGPRIAGLGSAYTSHIRSHYEDSLHTYVVNVDRHDVWDFAGDGFVHRLVMHKADDDVDPNNAGGDADDGRRSAQGQQEEKVNDDGTLVVTEPSRQQQQGPGDNAPQDTARTGGTGGDGEGEGEGEGEGSTAAASSTGPVTVAAAVDAAAAAAATVFSRLGAGSGGGGPTQNGSGGDRESWHASRTQPRYKLVEVPDPHTASTERPSVAPMSDAREERLVHQKLEDLAQNYNGMLSWQLQHQREFYADELDNVYSEIERVRQEGAAGEYKSGHSDTAAATLAPSPGDRLVRSLRAEQQKLQQRCRALKQRLEHVQEEGQFAHEVNDSLRANQEQWVQEATDAERTLQHITETSEESVSAMQEQLSRIMALMDDDATETNTDSLAACVDVMRQLQRRIAEGHSEFSRLAPGDSMGGGSSVCGAAAASAAAATARPSSQHASTAGGRKKRNRRKKGTRGSGRSR